MSSGARFGHRTICIMASLFTSPQLKLWLVFSLCHSTGIFPDDKGLLVEK